MAESWKTFRETSLDFFNHIELERQTAKSYLEGHSHKVTDIGVIQLNTCDFLLSHTKRTTGAPNFRMGHVARRHAPFTDGMSPLG